MVKSVVAAMFLVVALSALYYFYDKYAAGDTEGDDETQSDTPDWEPVQRRPRQAS